MTEKIKLTDKEIGFAKIPESLILDTEIHRKAIMVYAFLQLRKGADSRLTFSVDDLIRELGYVPKEVKGAINDQVKDVLQYFITQNYLTIISPNVKKITSRKYITYRFNTDCVNELFEQEKFAIVYQDEFQILAKYKSSSIQKATLFFMFAYLRLMIPRRKSQFVMNNVFANDEERKKFYPDVYGHYLRDISAEISINERTVSKAVKILDEIGLIHSYAMKNYKSKKANHWISGQTLFCNFYKREQDMLVAAGSEYYDEEIKNKINLLLGRTTLSVE